MNKELRVLIIEDSEDDTRLLLREFGRSRYNTVFERVQTPESMKEALEKQHWDVIISDYVLPNFSGLAALDVLQGTGLDLPFIVVSGNIGEDIAVHTMKAGAHDYIMKDNLKRLVPAVERELHEAEVRRERKHVREALEFSHRLLQIANRHTATAALLKEVIEEIKKFTGCAALGIRLLDNKGNIPYEAFTGFPEEFSKLASPLSLHSDHCLCASVIGRQINPAFPFRTAGGSLYMNGTTRFLATASEEQKGQIRNTCNQFGYESVAVIPIPVEGSIIGALHLADPRENLFPLQKVEILENGVLQVGMAIERKRAEEQLKESAKQLKYLSSELLTAQESERKRIAIELHDGVLGSLTAVKVRIETVLGQMEQDERAQAGSRELISQFQEIIAETRRIMSNLCPSMLDELGITAAINWLCREFQNTYSGVSIEKHIDLEENDIPRSLRTPMFRIFQEALNNVAKHSKATFVNLSLRKSDNRIELTVRDNGRGFDPEAQASAEDSRSGLGLVSMRERAELSVGSFIIDSVKGAGTVIRVSWPYGNE